MLGDADLTNSYDVDGLYRSAAMLQPGAMVLNREETMRVLAALRDQLIAAREAGRASGC